MFDATTFDTLMAHSAIYGTTYHMDSNLFHGVREHINATFKFHGVAAEFVIWTCLTCNSVGEARHPEGRDYHGHHTDFTDHGCTGVPIVYTFTSTPFCKCIACVTKED